MHTILANPTDIAKGNKVHATMLCGALTECYVVCMSRYD